MQRIKKKRGPALYLALACVFILTGCQKAEPEESGLTRITPEEMTQETSGETGAEPDGEEETGEDAAGEDASGEEEPEEPARIFVYVCGQVQNPGVYELEAGSRVYEALDAAGGVTGEAAGEYLNQAGLLKDGQQVYVPTRKEAEEGSPLWQNGAVNEGAPGPAETSGTAEDARINLNQATKEELMTLTGIGEVKAEAILKYREEHGPFGSIEEIKEIEGIKDGIFQKIRDDITV